MIEEEREDLVSAEDVVEEIREDEVVEEQLVEDEVVDEEVQKAKKYGHISKEDWIAQGRNPNEWKSPEEYNKTGEIIDQLMSMRKQIERRDREIQALVDYQQRTAQREYEKAKQELEHRLNNSKQDMDMEGVAHYTKELVRLQDMEQNDQVQKQQRLQQDAQQRFLERNQHWFNDRNPDLKQRAIEIDSELKELYPNATYDQLAQKIESRMQYEYPERISGQSRARPVIQSQSSVNKTAAVKKDVFKNLSQEHRDTYNVYKRINPKITEAEFIQKLKNDGEL